MLLSNPRILLKTLLFFTPRSAWGWALAGSRASRALPLDDVGPWMSRSQIESASVGSPMSSGQAFTGAWLVIRVEACSVRSSRTSRG